jgi:hypothetical protein
MEVEIAMATGDLQSKIKHLTDENAHLLYLAVDQKAAAEGTQEIIDQTANTGNLLRQAKQYASDLLSKHDRIADLNALQRKDMASAGSHVERLFRISQEKSAAEKQYREKKEQLEVEERIVIHEVDERLKAEKLRLEQQGHLISEQKDGISEVNEAVKAAQQSNQTTQAMTQRLSAVSNRSQVLLFSAVTVCDLFCDCAGAEEMGRREAQLAGQIIRIVSSRPWRRERRHL